GADAAAAADVARALAAVEREEPWVEHVIAEAARGAEQALAEDLLAGARHRYHDAATEAERVADETRDLLRALGSGQARDHDVDVVLAVAVEIGQGIEARDRAVDP